MLVRIVCVFYFKSKCKFSATKLTSLIRFSANLKINFEGIHCICRWPHPSFWLAFWIGPGFLLILCHLANDSKSAAQGTWDYLNRTLSGLACSAANHLDDVKVDWRFFLRKFFAWIQDLAGLRFWKFRYRGILAYLHALCIFLICQVVLHKKNYGHHKENVGLSPVLKFFI